MEGQIVTTRSVVSQNPADFANSQSLVLATEPAVSSPRIEHTGGLSQTRSCGTTKVGNGKQLVLSFGTSPIQSRAIPHVIGVERAVSNTAAATGKGNKETRSRGSGVKTNAHSGAKTQGGGRSTTANTAADYVAAVNTDGQTINISTRRHLDTVSDVGTNILVSIRRRDDHSGVGERDVSTIQTRAISLSVIVDLVGTQSLERQIDVANSLLGNPARLEHHTNRTANGLVAVSGFGVVSVTELERLFVVPVTKNVGVVPRIDLGNLNLVSVSSHG